MRNFMIYGACLLFAVSFGLSARESGSTQTKADSAQARVPQQPAAKTPFQVVPEFQRSLFRVTIRPCCATIQTSALHWRLSEQDLEARKGKHSSLLPIFAAIHSKASCEPNHRSHLVPVPRIDHESA